MLLALAAALVAVLASTLTIAVRRQQQIVNAHVDGLRQAAAGRPPDAYTADVDRLPPPVARYLRWALPDASPIHVVEIHQAGRLRTDTRSERWMPFTATHVAAPHAIGFVWDAHVRLAPLLRLRVRDSYHDGVGEGHVSLLSALTLAADDATPEMNAGSLHRFLAEAVWYPSALRPSPRLQWTPVDDQRAVATLTDAGVTVSLEFRFAPSGEVTGIHTPARWGRFDGAYAQRPWEGHFRHYSQRDGLIVPGEGEVGWYVDGVWHAVWQGTVTTFRAQRQ